jgi:metal-responsive CopG/Arc/MetJ family transcriptional regulator
MQINRIDSRPLARDTWLVREGAETSVRLPECAVEALESVARRFGVSRDEAVRRILDQYLQTQEERDAEEQMLS